MRFFFLKKQNNNIVKKLVQHIFHEPVLQAALWENNFRFFRLLNLNMLPQIAIDFHQQFLRPGHVHNR